MPGSPPAAPILAARAPGRARAALPPFLAALAFLAGLALAVLPSLAGPAAAQTVPVPFDSAPARDAVVTVAPTRVEVTFIEPVDPALAPSLTVVGPDGATVPTGAAAIDPANPAAVAAALPPGLRPGPYSVFWTARGAVGHATRSGTFAFRLAPPGPAGAAADAASWPAWWGVGLRWLGWLGLAAALAGGLLGRAAARAGAAARSPVSGGLVAGGGALALLAAATQPLLLAGSSPGLGARAAAGAMPLGWWLLPAAALLLVLLGLDLLAGGLAARAVPRLTGPLAVLLALAGAAGLALSAGEGGAAAGLRLLHAWATTSVAAGALALALGGALPAGAGETRGRRLLPFAAVALGVVALLAGAVPAARALAGGGSVDGPWGVALVAKLVFSALLAAAAVVMAVGLRRGGAGRGAATLAAGLGGLVLLAGSLLALSAPPTAAAGRLAQVDLVGRLPRALPGLGDAPGAVHLVLRPTSPGPTVVAARLTSGDGAPPDGRAPLALRLAFAPLDHPAAPATLEPAVDPATGLAVGTVDLPGEGWWQVTATATSGDAAAAATFDLVLPDPNLAGRGPAPAGDPRAEEVFRRGLATFGGLRSVAFDQRLNSGSGSLFASETVVTEQPPAYRESAPGTELVIVDGTQWARRGSDPWQQSPAGPLPVPSSWAAAYDRAAGFRLGPVETVDGEPCQVVTFSQPSPSGQAWAAAWYAWWVGTETGFVRRETMVAPRHYMRYDYRDFNASVTIAPPAAAATPAGG